MKSDYESEKFKAWKAALLLDGLRQDERAVEWLPDFMFWEIYDRGIEPTIEAVKQHLKDDQK